MYPVDGVNDHPDCSDQLLEPPVFILDLSQPSQFTHSQVSALLLPEVEGGLAHPQSPADVRHRRPSFRLA